MTTTRKTTTLSLLHKEINNRFKSKAERIADWEAFLDYMNNLKKADFQISSIQLDFRTYKFENYDQDGESVPQDYFIGIEFDENFILNEVSCSEGTQR